MKKPSDLFDRDREWTDLAELVRADRRGSRLGIVYGRRRQGKTMLVQALAASAGGFWWEAAQQSRTQNLRSFATAWARHEGAPAPYSFQSWEDALTQVFRRSGHRRVVVFDEVGYLIETAPEFPSLLQREFGPSAERSGEVTLLLCGSVFASMKALVAANAPLRGRQSLNLQVDPFDYRTAASFWGLDRHPDLAFRLHALIGGTPAYRRFTGGDAPMRDRDFDRWAARWLLDPSSPLVNEGSLLIAEDPTLADKSLYWSVLGAIADGHVRRKNVAEAVGRPDAALTQSLGVLQAAGWIELRRDPFHANASTIVLDEPMLRTWRVLVSPALPRLRRVTASDVWRDNEAQVGRLIYGPHLETLVNEWLMACAGADRFSGPIVSAGPGVLRAGGERHQLDVVGTIHEGPSSRPSIAVIGEAKAGLTRVGMAELQRLDVIAPQVGRRAAARLHRLLVARGGFTAELRRAADRRSDVHLVDLDELYHG